MSLDVEGNELNMLQGVDHKIIRFNLILIESTDNCITALYHNSIDYAPFAKFESDLLFKSIRPTLGVSTD